MYKQLTSEQRYAISVLPQTGTSIKMIAERLGASVSTISRELRRNSSKRGGYNPKLAHTMVLEHRERISRNSCLMRCLRSRSACYAASNGLQNRLALIWPNKASGYLMSEYTRPYARIRAENLQDRHAME